MDKLKKGLIGSILISVILAVTLGYVWATTPTTTFYISTGVYPGAPYYTVWSESSGATQTCYAKRYDGYIPTWSGSTNTAQVIQEAIDATESALWQVSASIYVKGDITLTSTLNLTSRRGFLFQFETLEMSASVDKSIFNITADYNHRGTKIIGDNLIANNVAYTSPVIGLYATGVSIDVGTISCSNVGIGIYLSGNSIDGACYFNDIKIGFITGALTSVYLLAKTGQVVSENHIYIKMMYTSIAFTGVKIEQRSTGGASHNTFYQTLFEGSGNDGDVGFWNNCTYDANTLLECKTVDLSLNAKSIVNSQLLNVIGGSLSLLKITNTGTIVFSGGIQDSDSYKFLVKSGSHPIGAGSNTSIVFDHGLVTTPTFVSCSFSETGYGTWKWTATATQITVTIQTSVAMTVYWNAEYQP